MLYAIGSDGSVTATPRSKAVCPECAAPVRAKCGKLVTWHWAHLAGVPNCDPWHEETEWHRWWKSRWPAQCVEQTIAREGVRHRADVKTPRMVVEFQHSPISHDEIQERERFYGRMAWVFDARSAYDGERLGIVSRDTHIVFRWKQARRSIASCKRPVFLNHYKGHLLKIGRLWTDEGRYRGWCKSLDYREFVAWSGAMPACLD
jgi:competence protein CoiA